MAPKAPDGNYRLLYILVKFLCLLYLSFYHWRLLTSGRPCSACTVLTRNRQFVILPPTRSDQVILLTLEGSDGGWKFWEGDLINDVETFKSFQFTSRRNFDILAPFTRVRTNFCTDKDLHGSKLGLHGSGGTGRIFERLSVHVWDLKKAGQLFDRHGSNFVWTRVNTRAVQHFPHIARLRRGI